MANFSFLTTVKSYRDPQLLWPLAGLVSAMAHGLALVFFWPLLINAQSVTEGSDAPLPIQLIALPPDVSIPVSEAAAPVQEGAVPLNPNAVTSPTAEPGPPPTAEGPDAPLPAEPGLPSTAEGPVTSPAPVPMEANPVAPGPALPPWPYLPQPEDSPTAIAPSPQPPSPQSPPPQPPPPQPPLPAEPISPPQPEITEPVAPQPTNPPAAQGGQLIPLGIRLDPNGRDIPETAPRLLSTASLAMQPLPAACGLGNLEAFMGMVPAATLQLQVQVEASGEISRATVLQGTGNAALDDLVSCLVKQRLRLEPATSQGVAQLTDAFILETRVLF